MLHLGQKHFFPSLNAKGAKGWRESEGRQRSKRRQRKLGSFDPFAEGLRWFKMKESLTTSTEKKKLKEQREQYDRRQKVKWEAKPQSKS